MFIVKNFGYALASVLNLAVDVYIWIVIIRALVTWVQADPRNPIVRFLASMVDPVTNRIRRIFPFVRAGMVDLSPLLLIFGLYFLKLFVIRTLLQLSG